MHCTLHDVYPLHWQFYLQSKPKHRADAVHGLVLPSNSAASIRAAVPET